MENKKNNKEYMILIINPGSTSTKLAVFNNDKEKCSYNIMHDFKAIKNSKKIIDQLDFRKTTILDFLKKNNIELKNINCIVARGGLLKPVKSGVYYINDKMLSDLKTGKYGEHASNLGGIIAHYIAGLANKTCKAYIADPVVVDEMKDIARISGLPEIMRKSIFHALNQKSAAKQACMKIGKNYYESNLIVAHLGGGISVAAHEKGSVIDVNNALDGDGPFSPERSGGLPAGQLIALCYSGKYSYSEMKKKIIGNGGLVSYIGSNNLQEIDEKIKSGNKDYIQKTELILNAMAYQISQEIAKHSATFKGNIDCIVLTGGMTFHTKLIDLIIERITHIAGIEIMPGEFEMISLAEYGINVLNGKEHVKEYI